jgi:uncharacterized Zn finger protein
VLEGFDIGARLGRGRSYARSGQVVQLEIGQGLVRAAVQGSRPQPYEVTIEMTPLPPKAWHAVLAALASQPLFAARLLAGDMPRDIEQVFSTAGTSLFPETSGALRTSCSCPDWSNPCKHIAAVYYLIGEAFDRDPFLLFRLRGLTREELVARLTAEGTAAPPVAPQAVEPGPASRRRGTRGAGGTTAESGETGSSPSEGTAAGRPPAVAATALSADPAQFWRAPVVPPDFHGAVAVPAAPDSLLHRLGHFPFWRGERALDEVLGPVYSAAAAAALEVFVGGD